MPKQGARCLPRRGLPGDDRWRLARDPSKLGPAPFEDPGRRDFAAFLYAMAANWRGTAAAIDRLYLGTNPERVSGRQHGALRDRRLRLDDEAATIRNRRR